MKKVLLLAAVLSVAACHQRQEDQTSTEGAVYRGDTTLTDTTAVRDTLGGRYGGISGDSLRAMCERMADTTGMRADTMGQAGVSDTSLARRCADLRMGGAQEIPGQGNPPVDTTGMPGDTTNAGGMPPDTSGMRDTSGLGGVRDTSGMGGVHDTSGMGGMRDTSGMGGVHDTSGMGGARDTSGVGGWQDTMKTPGDSGAWRDTTQHAPPQ